MKAPFSSHWRNIGSVTLISPGGRKNITLQHILPQRLDYFDITPYCLLNGQVSRIDITWLHQPIREADLGGDIAASSSSQVVTSLTPPPNRHCRYLMMDATHFYLTHQLEVTWFLSIFTHRGSLLSTILLPIHREFLTIHYPYVVLTTGDTTVEVYTLTPER
jgi:hypothetical protein